MISSCDGVIHPLSYDRLVLHIPEWMTAHRSSRQNVSNSPYPQSCVCCISCINKIIQLRQCIQRGSKSACRLHCENLGKSAFVMFLTKSSVSGHPWPYLNDQLTHKSRRGELSCDNTRVMFSSVSVEKLEMGPSFPFFFLQTRTVSLPIPLHNYHHMHIILCKLGASIG